MQDLVSHKLIFIEAFVFFPVWNHEDGKLYRSVWMINYVEKIKSFVLNDMKVIKKASWEEQVTERFEWGMHSDRSCVH